jgi:PPOX class probable F420-dependent enzyme
MPGYGISEAEKGMLPWSWAEEKLTASRNYWVATVRPDGGPHVMPVWGIWDGDALWFSSSLGSRKVRNLRADPRCMVTIEDAMDPVVLEGRAVVVTDPPALRRFIDLTNAKYDTSYSVDFLDPAVNATIAVRPGWAFGLLQEDFSGTPTRWFPDEAAPG